MSGTVLPEFGVMVKVIMALLVLLGAAYLCVLIKLFLYDNHSVTWRVIFGAITPALLILGFMIAHLTDNKTVNVIVFFLLTVINLIYLLNPVSSFFSRMIYGGINNTVVTCLTVSLSVLTSLAMLSVFLTAVYRVIKK